jgi:hypothetical protein
LSEFDIKSIEVQMKKAYLMAGSIHHSDFIQTQLFSKISSK